MFETLFSLTGLKSKWPRITAEEVFAQPYYIVAGCNVYDVAGIIGGEHPGGDSCLLRRGRGAMDCTNDLYFHSRTAKAKWEKLKIGEISTSELEKLALLHRDRLQCQSNIFVAVVDDRISSIDNSVVAPLT